LSRKFGHLAHSHGKRVQRIRWTLVFALIMGGAFLGWSWLARNDAWLSGALVNGGTTLLLFAPLLLAGRHVEHKLDEVRASQTAIEQRQEIAEANITTLTEEIYETKAELRRTREELSQAVTQRLEELRERDRSAFADVEEMPSHAVVFRALSRASKLNLIAEDGCRVRIHNTNIYLSFATPLMNDPFGGEFDPDADLHLRIQQINGDYINGIFWPSAMTAEDFLVELSEAVVRSGAYPGDDSFDATQVFADLRALLEVSYRSATSGGPNPLLGVIQFCGPQWVITEDALACVDRPYQIKSDRIDELDWITHMSDKQWVDQDSFSIAYEAASALYELRRG